MRATSGTSLIEHLKKVPDPRVKRSRRHELMDILVIALCATLGGADDWVEIVQFGQAKQDWFATFLELPNAIASHDTFGRVFQILDSQVLGQVQTDKKSNEITAIPKLLKLLSIQGCIVTIDAMGCQKSITPTWLAYAALP